MPHAVTIGKDQTSNPRRVFIQKETSDYRIVTDDPDNWYIVANRPIAKGELIISAGESFHIDVRGVEAVTLTLRETGETRQVSTSISAVPSNTECAQSVLEFPWCFMNHSCEPNTNDRWDQRAPFDLSLAETEAITDIAIGDELTFDYALEHYEYTAKKKCWCSSKKCRGIITGFKDLDETQKVRLLCNASPYVQERYRKNMKKETVGHTTIGRHLVIDYWDCDEAMLNDKAALELLLTRAAEAAGATVMSMQSHNFEHQGVTVVAVLGESHLSIHTWTEEQYAAVDLYSCGDCDPLQSHAVIEQALAAQQSNIVELSRGNNSNTCQPNC